jgi:uncharacterized membrane protein YbhN (UPF0104 family)
MNKHLWRLIASVTVLLVTLVAFVDYLATHPAIRQQLRQTSPETLVIILLLYVGATVALALVFIATFRLCKLSLGLGESTLVTMYSAIINFFGPLQSGPAFRAVYLKKKYNLKMRDYAVATIVYYFFFGVFNVALLFSGLLKWWLLAFVIAAIAGGVALRRNHRVAARFERLDLRGWYYLAGATLIQISFYVAIYYTELRSVSKGGIHLSQAIIYTGAANLSLFVSITPGAIGFREAFLLLAHRLHHISNGAIVAANTIDRSMYIFLLLILALVIFGTHARQHLKLKNESNEDD